MRKHINVLLAFSLLFGTSCNDPKQKKLLDIKKETIAIHDDVMPKMGEITELGAALKERRETLKMDTADSVLMEIGLLSEKIKQLDDAHEGMMQWMFDYEPRFEEEHPIDSAVSYYEKQRVYILEVKLDMEKSIEHAEALLAE